MMVLGSGPVNDTAKLVNHSDFMMGYRSWKELVKGVYKEKTSLGGPQCRGFGLVHTR